MSRILIFLALLVPSFLCAEEPKKKEAKDDSDLFRGGSGYYAERVFHPFVSDGERVFGAINVGRGTSRFRVTLPDAMKDKKLMLAEFSRREKHLSLLLCEGFEPDYRPILKAKRLKVVDENKIRLGNTDEAASFRVHLIEDMVIRYEDIEVRRLQFEYLQDDKPTGKFLALEPLGQVKEKPELQEIILGTQQQALTVTFKFDRGTSGK